MGPLRFALVSAAAVAVVAAGLAAVVPDGNRAPAEPAACAHQSLAVTPAQPRWRAGTVGAAAGISFPGDVLVDSDADLARQLDGMAEAGARWVRVDIDWSYIEEVRGEPDWCRPDRVVLAARQRGLDVVAIVAYAPYWATGSTSRKAGPRDPADFAAFAAAAAQRYAPLGVHAWEVWNEPNIESFWSPRPDVGAYARLLHAAAPAIRAADPAATVISAGLAPAQDRADGRSIAPETFLRRLYEAGAAPDFDAVGYHPYSFPAHPGSPGTPFSRLPEVHALMAANGDAGKQIWLTEFGAPTGAASGAVPEPVQADILREGFDALAAWPWAGPMLWYTYRDLGTDGAALGQHFGLVTHDFRAKPALAAFAAVMAAPGTP